MCTENRMPDFDRSSNCVFLREGVVLRQFVVNNCLKSIWSANGFNGMQIKVMECKWI